MNCPACGHTLSQGARFCTRCGTLLSLRSPDKQDAEPAPTVATARPDPVTESAAQQLSNCANCGKSLKPGSKFCTGCGTTIAIIGGAAAVAGTQFVAPPANGFDATEPAPLDIDLHFEPDLNLQEPVNQPSATPWASTSAVEPEPLEAISVESREFSEKAADFSDFGFNTEPNAARVSSTSSSSSSLLLDVAGAEPLSSISSEAPLIPASAEALVQPLRVEELDEQTVLLAPRVVRDVESIQIVEPQAPQQISAQASVLPSGASEFSVDEFAPIVTSAQRTQAVFVAEPVESLESDVFSHPNTNKVADEFAPIIAANARPLSSPEPVSFDDLGLKDAPLRRPTDMPISQESGSGAKWAIGVVALLLVVGVGGWFGYRHFASPSQDVAAPSEQVAPAVSDVAEGEAVVPPSSANSNTTAVEAPQAADAAAAVAVDPGAAQDASVVQVPPPPVVTAAPDTGFPTPVTAAPVHVLQDSPNARAGAAPTAAPPARAERRRPANQSLDSLLD